MPRLAGSGTKGLIKKHSRGCDAPKDPSRCDCQWKGRHKGEEVVLAVWCGQPIDPRSKSEARAVFIRFQAAIDNKTFSRDGEQPVRGDSQLFSELIERWREDHADDHRSNSLDDVLNVIKTSPLGRKTLEQMADAEEEIERWLNSEQRARKWSDATWERYYELLRAILNKATKWKSGRKPLLASNPMDAIEPPVVKQPQQFKQRYLMADVEDRLFAQLPNMDRPMKIPQQRKTEPKRVAAILARLAAGDSTREVEKAFKVSRATIYRLQHPQPRAVAPVPMYLKRAEMEGRLIAAFDSGVRRGEMMLVKVAHVVWQPLPLIIEGEPLRYYRILLPPDNTKGGASTGDPEYAYATTPRFIAFLQRRFAELQGNPPERQFIFGKPDGSYQAGFKKQWHRLFELAGLDYGRDKGLVWHTTRHEFISRMHGLTGNKNLVQEMARHKRYETTEGYSHALEAEKVLLSMKLAR